MQLFQVKNVPCLARLAGSTTDNGMPPSKMPTGHIFAKRRIPQPHLIHNRHQKEYHKHRQDDIFQKGKKMQFSATEFRAGNLVQQFLKPSEGAPKSRIPRVPAEPHQNQESHGVIRSTKKYFSLQVHAASAVALESLCLKSISQRNKHGTGDQNVHIQIHRFSIEVSE